MKHRMIIFLCISQGDSFEIDRESSDSTREQTPDSDSGYMASCVTVVSTTSSQNKTFQPPRTINNSNKPSGLIDHGIQSNNEEKSTTVVKHANASSNRPNFLAEMQSAQQKRRLSKENIPESGNSHLNTNNSFQNDVPKRNLPVIPPEHTDIQNAGRSNPFSNSLADQLKIRLEERRKNTDDSDIQNLAADVQKAVNIANESSK